MHAGCHSTGCVCQCSVATHPALFLNITFSVQFSCHCHPCISCYRDQSPLVLVPCHCFTFLTIPACQHLNLLSIFVHLKAGEFLHQKWLLIGLCTNNTDNMRDCCVVVHLCCFTLMLRCPIADKSNKGGLLFA